MKKVRKVDAIPKLDGSFRFVDDYPDTGMIHGFLYYARVDHGRIRKIILPTEFDLTEFTIVKANDIPGENIVPEPENDQPFMVKQEIFHYGQIIMGIAHPERKIVKQFCQQIQIEYEELPAIIDVKDCLENENNAFGKEITIDHRKHEPVAENWIKTSAVYYTPHQEQAYLETQAMIAEFDPDQKSMFIRGTMQCPYFVKAAVESIMGNKINKVVVETSEGIGGAFGGKEDFPNIIAGITALLSFKSGKTVKTVMDRSDDIAITTKRHPSRIEIESWTDPKSRRIKKINIDYRLDAGAYQTLSPVVLARGVLHSYGAYHLEDAYIKGRLFRSNTPSNGAFRGFGAPQAFFGIESHIEDIATKLKIDPAEFRTINLLKPGNRMPSNQVIKEDSLEKCLELVLKKSNYKIRKSEYEEFNKTNPDKKGIGTAICFHGGGYTGNGEKVLKSEVKLLIDSDEIVRIFVANTDMGQGAYTTLAQMVSEGLDHPLEKTITQVPNTSLAPDSGPTVASRTIYIVGNLLKELAEEIKSNLQGSSLSEHIRHNPQAYPQEYHRTFTPDPSISFDEETYQGVGYKDYSWAACVTEVYYHASTYQLEVTKIWNVLEIGKPVNLGIAEGQVQGGNIQALGYALSEFFYKRNHGRMHGFTDYSLPTTFDIPEIDIEFINTESDLAKGLGEIPMNYPAAAIRNALAHAMGIHLSEIPLIPERIYSFLKERS